MAMALGQIIKKVGDNCFLVLLPDNLAIKLPPRWMHIFTPTTLISVKARTIGYCQFNDSSTCTALGVCCSLPA